MEIDPYQSEFTVPGDPVPQSRPRVTRSGHVYYADRIVRYRREVVLAARAARLPLREGPVWLGIEAVFQRPKGHYKKTNVRADAAAFPFSRGDCSNLAKGIEDALLGVAYKDDSQVVELTVRKRWAKPGEDAAAIVTICDIEPLPDVADKRRAQIQRSWTVADREERRVHKPRTAQEERMLHWGDILRDEDIDVG